MSTIDRDLHTLETLLGARFLQAYLECSDEVQAGVRELLAVLNDPDADPDDRVMSVHTLAGALFPIPLQRELGVDLEEFEANRSARSKETASAVEEMDRQEAVFADRLAALMQERGITQEELAAKAGVGQPAISNMLNRRCRPQQRTIRRFAELLGVPDEILWPGIGR